MHTPKSKKSAGRKNSKARSTETIHEVITRVDEDFEKHSKEYYAKQDPRDLRDEVLFRMLNRILYELDSSPDAIDGMRTQERKFFSTFQNQF